MKNGVSTRSRLHEESQLPERTVAHAGTSGHSGTIASVACTMFGVQGLVERGIGSMRWREPVVFVWCVAACGRRELRPAAAAAPPKRAFVPLNTTVKHITTDINRALVSSGDADGSAGRRQLRRARATDGSRHDRGEQAQGLEGREPDGRSACS